ncbi:LOW QUALITY PROTEIN: carcinoembryonic antigen-related cell adhesion molecule 5-like [Acanthochromis polyacanthus]|uniref:LOW QUALITY PROTEIN: carcinoembryonic antigen-related cell adhesion molecule 5-like n=1 Tax=Acanthochromis polyacanthus TaxID=80966 RepID=UPI0022349C51|nr:LOW QUALITY PROTEIN: carcinoembryonic antigen-related cell adhesion molecule 5-like [Acanthochromis polyacanthus]
MKVIFYLCLSGLTEGAGVLPDGPLNAAVNGTFLFSTSLTPTETPFVSVSWSFGVNTTIITSHAGNTTPPEYEGRITLFPSTGSLELRNLTDADSGEYNITITAAVGDALSGRTTLDIYEPVSNVSVFPKSADVVEFTSVNLSCTSTGSSISFLWLNDTSEVTASDRVHLTDGGSTLTIVNVTRYDQQPFRCRVFNPVSNGTSDPVNIMVSFGPENTNLLLSPSEEYFAEGSDVRLFCSADSRPPAQFLWFLNGEILLHTEPELNLTNIQMNNAGNYSCQTFNNKTMRNETSEPRAISVLVSNVSVFPKSADVVEFTSVSLSCSSFGSSISFLWLNDTSEVTASDRVHLTDGGSTLTIVNVTRYDQQPFRCHVFNPVSNGTSDPVNIMVSFGPENTNLLLSPSEEYFAEGSDVRLFCSADSRPPAQFLWFLNGEILLHTEPELNLTNIQMNNAGNYSCQTFNNKTMRNETSEPRAISVLVSNVSVFPKSADVVEFTSVSLSCSSTGSSISFLWLNDTSEVTASDRVHLTDGGSTLTIVNVTRYDQQPFRCRVFNPVSNGTSDPVNIMVSFGPENTNLLLSPSEEYFAEGSDVRLFCSADSRPPAQFLWFLNGEILLHTEPELNLTNIQMNNAGNYSCQTFNNKTMRNETSEPRAISVLVSNVSVFPKSADVVEFTSVSLSCSSFGSSISFLWLNDTSEVTASDRVHLTDGGSTLTIVNVTRYDQQPFRCRVFNPVSNGTSDPVNIMVSFGPENTNLLLSPPEEYFAEGSNVRLICSTESGPPAQFLWFLNGESLLHTEPELILTNIQMNNAGNYSCQTFNNKTMRNETSEPRAISVLEQSSGCSAGCIAGIVIACCVLIAGAVGVGFYVYRKKKPPKTSSRRNTSTGDKGKDNTGYSSEEVNYADVRFLRNKNGGEVQLGLQNTSSDYAQVRVNSGPPAAASPPNYDAHMQRVKTQAPQAGTNGVQSEA